VAYALLLCAVLAVVLAGATILGSTVEQTLAHVAGSPSTGSSLSVANSGNIDVTTKQQGSHKTLALRVVLGAVMSLVAMGAAGAGWVMTKRPSESPPEESQLTPRREPVEEKMLATRLNSKKASLWQLLLEDHELLLKNRIEVRHVMTHQPIAIDPSSTGEQMAELFRRHDVAHLLVRDKDGRFLGMVRHKDHEIDPEQRADTLLKPSSNSVSSSTTLGAAISQLMDQDSSLLPVVDEGMLVGLLTPTDLVLTLHCSMQLWGRVARTMDNEKKNVENWNTANNSIDEAACDLKRRVQSLPNRIETAFKAGNAEMLYADINQMSGALSQLMDQLESVRNEVRRQKAELADLKDPTPDGATGASSGEELNRILDRLSDDQGKTSKTFALVLLVADEHTLLLSKEGRDAADDYMRSAYRAIATTTPANSHIARYREDAFAVVLPGAESAEARSFCRQLTTVFSAELCQGGKARPKLSVVSARPTDTPEALLKRAEAVVFASRKL